MEALELDKLLSLSGLIALGFVFRSFYRLQLQTEKEEASELLLWSLVFSAILGISFRAFGRHLDPDFVKRFVQSADYAKLSTDAQSKLLASTGQAIAATFNLGWACAFGIIIGRIRRGWVLSEREIERDLAKKDGKLVLWLLKTRAEIDPKEKNGRLLVVVKFLVKTMWRSGLSVEGIWNPLPHYGYLLLEYLDKYCRNSYIVVTFNDGTAVMGFFQLGDKIDDDKACIMLKYIGPFDIATQTAGPVTSHWALLNLDDVRSIEVTPPSNLRPAS